MKRNVARKFEPKRKFYRSSLILHTQKIPNPSRHRGLLRSTCFFPEIIRVLSVYQVKDNTFLHLPAHPFDVLPQNVKALTPMTRDL